MLHKYEKIDEAMAACVALEYPLIVVLHGPLPATLSNADEATRGASGGNSGGVSAAPTYSFLPRSYGTGTSHPLMGGSGGNSSSLFADDSVPLESTLAAPNHDAATANTALGYLMRPANLTAAAAADRAAVSQAVADGEELALVPDFPLGSLQGGAAQREALLITLLESRLGSVTLLHLIEQGTPAFDFFSNAVPVPAASAAATAAESVVPRVHVFYAPTVGLAPMVLHGAALTPQNLFNCVQMGLLKPRSRGEGAATASAAATQLRTFFTSSVSAMDAEFVRSRSGGAVAMAPPPPQQQQHHGDPSSRPASGPSASAAAGGGGASANSSVMAAPSGSRADVLSAAHLISVAGLPTSFSTRPSSAPSAHKTILTTPAMTMQTVWRAVEKHLEWAQNEVQQAQAASNWNGTVPPKPGTAFCLKVEKTDAAEGLEVRSLAQAGQVRLQDYPRNTVVQVVFDGWPSAPAASAPAAPLSNYVCEGYVCRRRTPDTPATAAAAETMMAPSGSSPSSPAAPSGPASPPASAASQPAAATTTNTTTAAAASSVKLHCSLPNGKTLDVAQLNPLVDTLQANVRPAIAEALGHDRFLFVCAYPPKRYSAETDEPRPLQEIGLGRSCALRVVATDGPGSPNAATGGAASTASAAGPARQMLSTAASSLFGLLGGRRPGGSGSTNHADGNSNNNSNSGGGGAREGAPSSASSSSQPPQRRVFTSMAEMLAANEAAERETAMERLRQEQQRSGGGGGHPGQQPMGQDPADQRLRAKKSNRYFGGGSTEFVAEDSSDDDNGGADRAGAEAAARAAVAGMTQEQQAAYLREQLQRIMQQHRNASGEGDDEDDEEEERGSGSAARAPEQRRVFQGQGRRLAGDSAQPPIPENESEAKKQQ